MEEDVAVDLVHAIIQLIQRNQPSQVLTLELQEVIHQQWTLMQKTNPVTIEEKDQMEAHPFLEDQAKIVEVMEDTMDAEEEVISVKTSVPWAHQATREREVQTRASDAEVSAMVEISTLKVSSSHR